MRIVITTPVSEELYGKARWIAALKYNGKLSVVMRDALERLVDKELAKVKRQETRKKQKMEGKKNGGKTGKAGKEKKASRDL